MKKHYYLVYILLTFTSNYCLYSMEPVHVKESVRSPEWLKKQESMLRDKLEPLIESGKIGIPVNIPGDTLMKLAREQQKSVAEIFESLTAPIKLTKAFTDINHPTKVWVVGTRGYTALLLSFDQNDQLDTSFPGDDRQILLIPGVMQIDSTFVGKFFPEIKPSDIKSIAISNIDTTPENGIRMTLQVTLNKFPYPTISLDLDWLLVKE